MLSIQNPESPYDPKVRRQLIHLPWLTTAIMLVLLCLIVVSFSGLLLACVSTACSATALLVNRLVTWRAESLRKQLSASPLFLLSATLFAAPRPEQIPLFHIRIRVVSLRGAPPIAHAFQLQFGASNTVVHESEWSVWMAFDRQEATRTAAACPATHIPGWPIVLHVQAGGVFDTTDLEAELKFDENGDTRLLR